MLSTATIIKKNMRKITLGVICLLLVSQVVSFARCESDTQRNPDKQSVTEKEDNGKESRGEEEENMEEIEELETEIEEEKTIDQNESEVVLQNTPEEEKGEKVTPTVTDQNELEESLQSVPETVTKKEIPESIAIPQEVVLEKKKTNKVQFTAFEMDSYSNKGCGLNKVSGKTEADPVLNLLAKHCIDDNIISHDTDAPYDLKSKKIVKLPKPSVGKAKAYVYHFGKPKKVDLIFQNIGSCNATFEVLNGEGVQYGDSGGAITQQQNGKEVVVGVLSAIITNQKTKPREGNKIWSNKGYSVHRDCTGNNY